MVSECLTCGECGYEMADGKTGDPCPECYTSLDTRKDAYEQPWKLKAIGISIAISIVWGPLFLHLSDIYLIPMFCLFLPGGFLVKYHSEIGKDLRVSKWAARLVKINFVLFGFAIFEFLALLAIETKWPHLVDWW